MLSLETLADNLILQTAFNKSSLSMILSGDRKMNKSVKTLFYYYFLSFELNRDLRVELNGNEITDMQDELTAKMHEEFTVRPETELKLKIAYV